MRARIRVQGRDFEGAVASVANRPQSNWMSTAKKYIVQVRIDGEPGDLRPGFTAEVEIIVAQLEDVIAVPVAAVAEQRGKFFCGVRAGETVERREVTLGQGNDKLIEITDGLLEGDVVVLNPRAAIGEEPADGEESSGSGEGGGKRRGPRSTAAAAKPRG
jgi:multidrug efflux pump subunit AcrA (membrane-fusion protein)